MQSQTTDLTVLQRYGALAISASDPRLLAVAHRLGPRNPAMLLTQIQKHIPAPLEQQIFVALASNGYDLRPEKFAEILTAHRGPSPLTMSAFERKEISPGVFFSSIDAFQDFVNTIISVIEDAKFSSFSCSLRSAIVLVQTYGEKTETVLSSIMENAEDIYYETLSKKKFGESQTKIVSVIVNFLARKIIPACQETGILPPVDIMSFFEDASYAQARAACMHEGQQLNLVPAGSITPEGSYYGDE